MDRRVKRTRAALLDALMEITRESGWNSASVSAVAARADVGRTTFYEHFDDREHLLRDGIDELMISFMSPDGSTVDVVGVVDHVLDAGSTFGPFLEIPEFRTAVTDALVASVPGRLPNTNARFVAGGLLALCDELARGGPAPHAADVEGLIRACLGTAYSG